MPDALSWPFAGAAGASFALTFGTGAVVARELYAYHGDALFEAENLANDPAQAGRVEVLSALLPRPARRAPESLNR